MNFMRKKVVFKFQTSDILNTFNLAYTNEYLRVSELID